MKMITKSTLLLLPMALITACETTQTSTSQTSTYSPTNTTASVDHTEPKAEIPTFVNYEAETMSNDTVNTNENIQDQEDPFLAQADMQETEDVIEDNMDSVLIDLSQYTTPLAERPEKAPILFGFDKTELDENAVLNLLPHVEYLNQNPQVTLTIIGHADATGPAEYNQYLSELRAKAVKQELINLGVEEKQLIIEAKGENALLANATANKEHRRVELAYPMATAKSEEEKLAMDSINEAVPENSISSSVIADSSITE